MCGGKLSDVTLGTLTKLTIEVQLAVRKSISGYGPLGKPVGGAGKVGLEQLLAITLSPDLPPDDSVSTAIRAANDVTNPGRLAQLAEVFQTSSSKSDAVGDGVRTVRVPAAAVESKHALHAIQLADHAVLSTIRCSRPSRPLLHLLPKLSTLSVSPPPSPVRSYFTTQGIGEEEEEGAATGRAAGKDGKDASKIAKPDESMWTPSSEAAAALDFATAAFGSAAPSGAHVEGKKQAAAQDAAFDVDFGSSAGPSAFPAAAGSAAEFDLDFPPEAPKAAPELPTQLLSLRVAAQVSETVTLAGKVGLEAPQSVEVTGTAACKYVYGATLSPAVQDSGHAAVPFTLRLQTAGALAALSVTPVGSSTATVVPIPSTHASTDATASHTYSVPVLLPARPPNVQGNVAGDLCTITYKYAPAAVPSLLKASASCRLTFAPADGGEAASGVQHKHTDVILKSLLDGRMSSVSPAQVQFLVPLPAPPGPTSGSADGPAYQPPLAKPQAQWSNVNGKPQLLWALAEQATGGVAEEATVAAHFTPGRQAELKARVPVTHGLTVPSADQYQSILPLPLQIRFLVPSGAIAPVALTGAEGTGAEGGADRQPITVDGQVSGHQLSVQVAGVLMKATSQVRGLFRI